MRKGINAWCFPNEMDLIDILGQAKKLHFEGVEINLSTAPNAGLRLDQLDEDLPVIKKAAEEFQIAIPSISTDLLWKYPLTDPDPTIRKKGIDIVKQMLKAAKYLDSKTILVVPGVVTEEASYETVYYRAIEAVKLLAEDAERLQVNIGIENVWNKFLLSPLEMAAFIDEVSNPWVGSYFDVGNVINFGYPEQWIRILSHRIISIHVKDFKKTVGNLEGFVPLLSGDVDWNKINTALRQINYKGYIIPEISPHQVHPDLLLKQISETVDSLFDFSVVNR
jgi:L-ribulose-5-phosphate 3-epimerase